MKDESQGDEVLGALNVSPFKVNVLHFVKDIQRWLK